MDNQPAAARLSQALCGRKHPNQRPDILANDWAFAWVVVVVKNHV
jgi:hypothetical protein